MYRNKPIPSNALAIASRRAKDICDRLIDSQIQQGILDPLNEVMITVETLRAIEGLNKWSLAVNCAKQNNRHAYLGFAHSSFLRNVEVCQPQIEKHGSVEKFLTHAETLIPVQEV